VNSYWSINNCSNLQAPIRYLHLHFIELVALITEFNLCQLVYFSCVQENIKIDYLTSCLKYKINKKITRIIKKCWRKFTFKKRMY